MISRLHGLLIEKQAPLVVIDVNGVGYETFVPMSTFYQLPELNTKVNLLTLMVVREDAITLYGFHSEAERQLFRDLLRVNGVGPKLALSILSTMELTTFVQAIKANDTARLTRIPGVGKKTAERLVLEMRDRLDKIPLDSPTATSSSPREIISPVDDAVSVLIALGYKPQEASRLVYSVKQEGMTSEELIRRALQSAL
jgi:holliday junction DNA helicase RuvA